jgi:hypothetical protein
VFEIVYTIIKKTTLKTSYFIPPIIAIGISAGWLGYQNRKTDTLKKQNSALQKAIATRSSALQDSPSGISASLVSQSLDWKKIADHFVKMKDIGSIVDLSSMVNLQKRVSAMNKEELIAALDEIAALDLTEVARDRLEQMLVGSLVRKDPEFALNKYIDRVQDPNDSLVWC